MQSGITRVMGQFGAGAVPAVGSSTCSTELDDLRAEVRQLREALAYRAVIEQAKGVLMAVHGCTAEAAFQILADQSQHTNTKVREVAQQLMDSVRGTSAPTASRWPRRR
ncbi:ANTAR domain-containing protein [Klenkia sp. PcliD-1-E]|uniref:ANTAR domain-containing response regulator n=1 Tax=Klenkia sp. PcliD-1-E TaxID=2954492 RepID=UPI0020969028|nr:ANTAR domain-containing protein [Klenkia sp. PcliD-1-E]MCO7218375.1 ANTAR domain-containing protein [Klenkia sp. PcliD-1-E]